jgi:hypothetical protein
LQSARLCNMRLITYGSAVRPVSICSFAQGPKHRIFKSIVFQ